MSSTKDGAEQSRIKAFADTKAGCELMLPDSSKSSLVDLLQARASTMGDKQGFRFVVGSGEEERSLTYRELHERAMAIAGELQTLAAEGERALLLFPPGLDFITGFFGCLCA